MIHGIGTDIVAIDRMVRLLERHGDRGAAKILSPDELEDYAQAGDSARFLAKRWVAKEALGKALGTGIRPPAVLPAIAVVHDPLGKPLFKLGDELQALMTQQNLQAHLSISDEAQYAVAVVILERP